MNNYRYLEVRPLLKVKQMGDDYEPCTCISIQFRFIRDNNNSLKDEVFSILQGSHPDIKVIYRSTLNNNKTTMYFKHPYEIITYFRNVIELMMMDDDKYVFFQMDIPGYPTTMVSFNDLKEREIVFKFEKVIESVLGNWPTNCESI